VHAYSTTLNLVVQVVSEVYALCPVRAEAHVVLSLVLYKMVDPQPDVREDALHMLHILSTREWQSSLVGTAAAAAAASSPSAAAGGTQGEEREKLGLDDDGVAEKEGDGAVVVLGALQDSYQQFQYQLSAKLARDHPELSEALCEEVMTRQLEVYDKVRQIKRWQGANGGSGCSGWFVGLLAKMSGVLLAAAVQIDGVGWEA
jgi:hypothetical protein